MGGATISDRDVARVLYTATGVIGPVLDVIEGCDVVGLTRRTATDPADDDSVAAKIATSLRAITDRIGLPGTRTWDTWSLEQRTEWWVGRVGRLSTVVVAYPGVFGAISNRLPLQDLLAFSQQAFVICAVQRVHGVHDRYQQTDQLAAVLCDRIVDSRRLLSQPVEVAGSVSTDIEEAVVAAREHKRSVSSAGIAKSVWATVGLLRSISDVLSHRPSPEQPWRLLGAVPVFGAVADYVGERSALRRAAEAAVASLRAPVRV